ncbi:hypothetical protein ScPMuIL_008403 [Solemya velum]
MVNKDQKGQPIETLPEVETSVDHEPVKLIFLDISVLPRSLQFVLLTSAIFACFLVFSVIQEAMFRLDGFRPYGLFLTLIQSVSYTVFGLIELQFKTEKARTFPLKSYGLIAFLTISTMGFSNASVGYLNYPTHVVFKCCQPIPVLIGGILIQGKSTNLIEILASLLISLGLIFFTLADSTVSPHFNLFGVSLVCCALVADGCLGNVQEITFKKFKSQNCEMILYSYSFGTVYVLVGLVLLGQLLPAIVFCNAHPYETYGYALLISLTGYLGVNVVLTLVRQFGALLTITVTTCRKAVTMIFSFLFFSKPFTYRYVWSGLLIVLGIYLNLYNKNREKINSGLSECLRRIRQKDVVRIQHVLERAPNRLSTVLTTDDKSRLIK